MPPKAVNFRPEVERFRHCHLVLRNLRTRTSSTWRIRRVVQRSPNPLVLALLRQFTEMSDGEVAAIYALRCAFAHDFSLFNVHLSRPEFTHCFHLFGEPDGALVTLPTSRWNGDYSHRPSECRTSIGLTLLGNMVEGICARLPDMARSGELLIRLVGGPDELNHRYGLMKVRSRQTES